MSLDSREFEKEIRQMVQRKHSKDHPLIGQIESGELNLDQLKKFVRQFYLLFPKPFPKPIAAMLGRCPDDPDLERMWIENVMEESTGQVTGTDGHKDLYLHFASTFGLSREEMDKEEPLPETQAFLNWRELLIYQRGWLELFACQGYAFEGTAGERMTRIVNGLVNHYGYDRESHDLRYWTIHMSVDEEHMKVGPLAVERYATTEDLQEKVRNAVQYSLDMFWLFEDGVQRAIGAA